MIRSLKWSAIIVLLLVVAWKPVQADHPHSLALDGGGTVPLSGQARRAHLLGAVDLYSLALYVEGSLRDRAILLSPGAQKALRIEVAYKDDIRRRTTLDWRRELVPTLEPPATAHLRGTFAPVRDGDVVLIEYVPGKGTTVRVNKAVVVAGVDHDLMLAFLDHWLGEQPVSEEVKRSLLGSS